MGASGNTLSFLNITQKLIGLVSVDYINNFPSVIGCYWILLEAKFDCLYLYNVFFHICPV